MKKRGRKPQSHHPPDIRKKMAASKWYHKNHAVNKAKIAQVADRLVIVEQYNLRLRKELHVLTSSGWPPPHMEPHSVYLQMVRMVSTHLKEEAILLQTDWMYRRDTMLFVAQNIWYCTAERLRMRWLWRDEEMDLLLTWEPLMSDFVARYHEIMERATSLVPRASPTVHQLLRPGFMHTDEPLWVDYTESGLISTLGMEMNQPNNGGVRRARLDSWTEERHSKIVDIQASLVYRWLSDTYPVTIIPWRPPDP